MNIYVFKKHAVSQEKPDPDSQHQCVLDFKGKEGILEAKRRSLF